MKLVHQILVFSLVTYISATPTVSSSLGIFGGQDASEGQFPYIISLQKCGWLVGCSHFCGGSIIAPTWVVSAGHCNDYGSHFQVVAGIVDLKGGDDTYRQTINVTQIIVNENYIGNANPNDISLIQLEQPLVYNERVQPIPLPQPGFDTSGPSVAAGWGQIGGNMFPIVPNTLQFINFTILTEEECSAEFDRIYNGQRTPYNETANVCTGDDEGGRAICSGDSGGPLVQDGVLIGLSSWSIMPCAQKGNPSVFTKLSSYIDWIDEKMSAAPAASTGLGIFGGQDASEGQFPYIISLQKCGWLVGCSHFCGGSIIAPTWVVSAGHCHDYGYQFQVVAGILDLKGGNDTYRQTVNVTQIIVNENYIGNANPNDISLIQLETPLIYNEWIQPINLPPAGFETTGLSVASGWGQSGGNMFPVLPNRLQFINFTILSQEECVADFDEIYHGQKSHYNESANVCTGDDEGGRSICHGDSGGPLVQDGVLIGLSSWGLIPCAQKGAPSVFTKLSGYIDWIDEKMSG